MLLALYFDRLNREGVRDCPRCGADHPDVGYMMGCPPDAPAEGVNADGWAWRTVGAARCPVTGQYILVQLARG